VHFRSGTDLDYTQTKVSRHLIYLKNAGLVSFKRVDNWAFYYLKEETVDFVGQIFSYLEKDALLQKDLEVYKVLYSNRELAVCKLHSRRWQV